MLGQGQPLALERGHPPQPGPAFEQQLVTGHERVFRAQPVGHDPQPVEGGLVKVGALQSADEFQRVHAAHGQHVRVRIPLGRTREDRVRDSAEGGRDDRLVEITRHHLAGFPPLPLPQQTRRLGQLVR